MIEAMEHIGTVTAGITLGEFEHDWQKRWLVERGVEIISEASRHLGADLKARNPDIPWPKVAGIGNILRHEYERIAPDILWKLIQDDLPSLERVCRAELARVEARQRRASQSRQDRETNR
jgi:uncharacterized protein with HEPN domain